VVNTQHCTKCGGLGRINTLEVPADDPSSDEGWETCSRCRGSGHEMAKQAFEVFFYFEDEDQARTFMDTKAPGSTRHGLRRVDVQKSLLDELLSEGDNEEGR
jgi:hypothetical protein